MTARPLIPAPIPRPIAEAATDWLFRREEGLSPEEMRAFQQWRTDDPRHEEALARLDTLWTELDTVPRAGEGTVVAFPPVARRGRVAASIGWVSALAAAILLAWLGGAGDLLLRLRADYSTGVGEQRRVALADGSVVQLDGDSAIDANLSSGRRNISLLKGRALFTVAPDPQRPFVVGVGKGSVTALGTQFMVALGNGQIDTVVTEHRISVRFGGGPSRVVAEGQSARWDGHGLHAPQSDDISASTAWTRGRLVVTNVPLGQAVAAIGRYRHGYTGIVGGEAAALRVSGVYDITHPDDALEALRKSLELQEIRVTDHFILLHR